MWTKTVYVWRATEIFFPQIRQWCQCSRYFRSNLCKYVLVQRSPLVWKTHICDVSNCFESFPSKLSGRAHERPARKKINLDGFSISIDKNSINRVEHTKFLGVIIHQNLSWQAHIKAISSKIATSTGIIIKSRQFFFSNTLCTLYNSLILPYLQYCLIIWASTYSSHSLNPFSVSRRKLCSLISNEL